MGGARQLSILCASATLSHACPNTQSVACTWPASASAECHQPMAPSEYLPMRFLTHVVISMADTHLKSMLLCHRVCCRCYCIHFVHYPNGITSWLHVLYKSGESPRVEQGGLHRRSPRPRLFFSLQHLANARLGLTSSRLPHARPSSQSVTLMTFAVLSQCWPSSVCSMM